MPLDGELLHRLQLGGRHFVEIRQNKTHPPLRFERVSMASQKVPIEKVERAGMVASAFAGAILAAFAIVAHFVDVVG